jgi:hypothetical protein
MIMDNKAELERITDLLLRSLGSDVPPSSDSIKAFLKYAYQLGHFDGHIAGVKFATNS